MAGSESRRIRTRPLASPATNRVSVRCLSCGLIFSHGAWALVHFAATADLLVSWCSLQKWMVMQATPYEDYVQRGAQMLCSSRLQKPVLAPDSPYVPDLPDSFCLSDRARASLLSEQQQSSLSLWIYAFSVSGSAVPAPEDRWFPCSARRVTLSMEGCPIRLDEVETLDIPKQKVRLG